VAALNLTAGLPDVEVVNLTGTVTGCLHDYQLTPANIKTLETADAFLYNGAGLET
jgi:zinc transport system substrate-binding protein